MPVGGVSGSGSPGYVPEPPKMDNGASKPIPMDPDFIKNFPEIIEAARQNFEKDIQNLSRWGNSSYFTIEEKDEVFNALSRVFALADQKNIPPDITKKWDNLLNLSDSELAQFAKDVSNRVSIFPK